MLKKTLKEYKDKYHRFCVFNSGRFKMDISFDEDGSLTGKFYCDESLQGYDGRMHGGILSAYIDSAMTQLLFSRKMVGYTVRLNIKYSRPVEINSYAEIYVKLVENKNHNIAVLSAGIIQKEIKRVSAEAKFWITKM